MQSDNELEHYSAVAGPISSADTPQTRMPGLYSLLTAPTMSAFPLIKPEPYDMPGPSGLTKTLGLFSQASFSGSTELSEEDDSSASGTTSRLDDVEWGTFTSTTSKQLHDIPSEVIQNSVRTKRARGYIARILAQQKDGAGSSVQSSETDDGSGRKKVCHGSSTPDSVLSSPHGPGVFDPAGTINMRKWRVKTVVDDHVQMMRALSATTISATKMPGDLKHMDLKPRLLGSDRDAILTYQDEMKRLLESEQEILQQLREALRPVTVTSNMVEEQFLATEIITSFDAPLCFDSQSENS